MVLVSLLPVAVKVAFALTYVGPVTVTANMGSFSPNPVQINNAVTANLSANYYPPSGVPEGDLSAQYNWSIGQVQYKALQADTYGTPPANSYTDSISPAQPSASSGATLTFTPLIAGYWAVSVSCGVTVTDTQTSQYWSGSGNAGPQDLTSVDVTFSPKNGSTAFVNTDNLVNIAYAPSDLTATLAISGGATFSGGATSEAMTSDSQDVYFYGPNVYSSGGPVSGQITVTVSPPSSGSTLNSSRADAVTNAAASAGAGSLNFKVNIDIFNLSGVWAEGLKNLASALVQSGVNFIMANLESNTNNYLNGLIQQYNGTAEGTAAQAELNYLNTQGYNNLLNNLATFIDDTATGSTNAATPPQINVLDQPNGLVLQMPGFPPSAVKNFTFAPSITASFKYPYISSSGQWQEPKLGDLVTTFGISGTGPISDDTLVPISGDWTSSLTASLSPAHNFTLDSGSYSASIGFDVDLFNSKNVQFAVQATGTFNPADGNVQNDASGQVVAGFVGSW